MCYFFVFCWQRPRGAKKGILSPKKKKNIYFQHKMKLIFRQLTFFSKQNPPKGVMPEMLKTENKTDVYPTPLYESIQHKVKLIVKTPLGHRH